MLLPIRFVMCFIFRWNYLVQNRVLDEYQGGTSGGGSWNVALVCLPYHSKPLHLFRNRETTEKNRLQRTLKMHDIEIQYRYSIQYINKVAWAIFGVKMGTLQSYWIVVCWYWGTDSVKLVFEMLHLLQLQLQQVRLFWDQHLVMCWDFNILMQTSDL